MQSAHGNTARTDATGLLAVIGMSELETLKALSDRGVWDVQQFRPVPEDALLGAIRWYDDQRAQGANLGPGALVATIRAGGKPGYTSERCTYSEQLRDEFRPLREKLRQAVGESMFGIWLRELHPHAHGDGVWTLGQLEPLKLAWLQSRWAPVIERTAGTGVKVLIVQCPRQHAARTAA